MLVFVSGMLTACAVEVNRGPFPIESDQTMVDGKASFLAASKRVEPSASPPNIVLILADDLGKHDISLYDAEGVQVPSLESLSRRGIRFSSAYTTSPVCSPSRAAMLTGRYQQRFGFERQPMNLYARNRLEYWAVDKLINTEPMQLLSPMASPGKDEMLKQGIPRGEILLPELLRYRGYRTGIFGKWHLGLADEFLPLQRGFEEHFGFYEAFTLYAPENDPDIVSHRHDYFANKHIWKQKRKSSCAIRHNGEEVEDKGYLTFSLADSACNFMDRHRDEPFFLYLPFSAPHTPFQVPEEYYAYHKDHTDHNHAVYYGMIEALDVAVGQILEHIESLGLEENTLVIFSSDNGGATYTGATDNGPLKAGKFSQFEGGVNVPLIISWPGFLPQDTLVNSPVSLVDLFATIAKASGSDLPDDRIIDGMDLIPWLKGEEGYSDSRVFFWRTDFNLALRSGQWKFIWNERDNQVLLFNLEKDPGEQEDLSAAYPRKVQDYKKLIRQWEDGLKEPMWPGVMEFRFDIDGQTTLWAI